MKRIGLILMITAFGMKVSAQTAINDSLKFEAARNEIITFLTMVHTAGMDSIYTGKTVTIFAPDNKALQMPQAWMDTLLKPANKKGLCGLLSNTVFQGKITSKDLSKLIHQNNGQTVLTMMSGNTLTAKINNNRNIVLVVNFKGNEVGECIIKKFDLQHGNATIFVIDSTPWPVFIK